jgi:hypothetical protein
LNYNAEVEISAAISQTRFQHVAEMHMAKRRKRVRATQQHTGVGRIEGGWVYEMQLQLQKGRWVVAQLRVFPDSDEFERDRLAQRLKYTQKVGTAADVADATRQLADLTRRGIRPAVVPTGGLTTRHLRKVPFGKGSVLEGLRELDKSVLKIKSSMIQIQEANKRYQSAKRELKTLKADTRLAWIARCYVEAQKRGSRQQNAEVARQLRLRSSQVRDAILWARRRDILSSTRQKGVSGGELTPKAIALLDSLRNVLKTPTLAAILNDGSQQLAVWSNDDETQ